MRVTLTYATMYHLAPAVCRRGRLAAPLPPLSAETTGFLVASTAFARQMSMLGDPCPAVDTRCLAGAAKKPAVVSFCLVHFTTLFVTRFVHLLLECRRIVCWYSSVYCSRLCFAIFLVFVMQDGSIRAGAGGPATTGLPDVVVVMPSLSDDVAALSAVKDGVTALSVAKDDTPALSVAKDGMVALPNQERRNGEAASDRQGGHVGPGKVSLVL